MKLGFISDAHGNLPAFQAGLQRLESEGVDQVFFLGDAVGYIPNPGVVTALRQLGLQAVRGNHEEMLNHPPADCESVYQLSRCRDQLTESDLSWLIGLPERLDLRIDGVDVCLCHGSPDNPVFGYVYPNSDIDNFNLSPETIFVCGNTHWPMARTASSGSLFCNPGSCGLPRDHGGLGAVGILDVATRNFSTIRYDILETSLSWADHCAPVHKSVYTLFSRSRAHITLGKHTYA